MRTRKCVFAVVLACIMTTLTAINSFAAVFGNNANQYRVIQVYQTDGTSTAYRENGEEIDLYTGRNLVSGDRVKVDKNSSVCLKLDDDKYVMAEGNTEFVLEATGTAKKSKTKITLIRGAIVNRVDGKLNKGSSYEVNTPTSTMAIRGTLVRTKTMSNPDQTQSTSTQVFEGTVEMHTVKPDGSVDPTPVQVNQNESMQTVSGENGTVAEEKQEVNYNELGADALQFLSQAADEGREVSIPKEELKTMATQKAVEKAQKASSANFSSKSSGGSSSGGSISASPSEAEYEEFMQFIQDNEITEEEIQNFIDNNNQSTGDNKEEKNNNNDKNKNNNNWWNWWNWNWDWKNWHWHW